MTRHWQQYNDIIMTHAIIDLYMRFTVLCFAISNAGTALNSDGVQAAGSHHEVSQQRLLLYLHHMHRYRYPEVN